jgi:hypothetical protein
MKEYSELLKNLPQILEMVSKDPKALYALIFIILAFVALAFFAKVKSSPVVLLVVFFSLFVLGAGIMAMSIFDAQKKLLAVELTGNTFVPNSKTNLHQISGCSCDDGDPKVSFFTPDHKPINSLETKAGQPATFLWDASYVCHLQGIKGYPANLGHMTFDGTNAETIPELYGTAKVTYAASSADPHSVRVDVAATCYDTGPAQCARECRASGELALKVDK